MKSIPCLRVVRPWTRNLYGSHAFLGGLNVENFRPFCLAERKLPWRRAKIQSLAHIPVGRCHQSRCRVRVYTWTSSRRPDHGRWPCLRLFDSDRVVVVPCWFGSSPFSPEFSFVFFATTYWYSATIQRSSSWHVPIAGFCVSSWEGGKQGATKRLCRPFSLYFFLGLWQAFFSFFWYGLCNPTFVQESSFSSEIWDRMESYSNELKVCGEMITLAHCGFVRAGPSIWS